MLGKRILNRVGWVGLVILTVALVQAPVMAQGKATDELAGVKVVLAGQMFIIEQLKDNFDTLSGIADEQAEIITELTEELLEVGKKNDGLTAQIKSLTDEFLRVVASWEAENAELQAKVDSRETENTELQKQIVSLTEANKKLKSEKLLLGLGFLVATYLVCTQ